MVSGHWNPATKMDGNKSSSQDSISGLDLNDPTILHWEDPYLGSNKSYVPPGDISSCNFLIEFPISLVYCSPNSENFVV
jgi:hypothetical protein